MQYLAGDSWLNWAVQLEDEVDCDVAAGLDLGQKFSTYLAKTKTSFNRQKIIAIFHEELGNILSDEEIEKIMEDTEKNIFDCIEEKFQNSNIA